MAQLTFDLPPQVSLGPDDYFVSEANARAYAQVTVPESWPDAKLALVGPKGSGKSHLARVFQHQTGALVWQASALPRDLPDCGVVVEDVQRLPYAAEETLFHLHNHLRARRLPFLFTADRAPARLSVRLPDLASRLQAATVAEISDPDDRLLMAVLMKHFADRQIAARPRLVAYLSDRIERSFAGAADIVARLDAEALASHEKISEKLARRLLDNRA